MLLVIVVGLYSVFVEDMVVELKYVMYCDMTCCIMFRLFFFFKQKTAYEMRISDWSSDVCSSDLLLVAGGPIVDVLFRRGAFDAADAAATGATLAAYAVEIGRASCRERVCQYV